MPTKSAIAYQERKNAKEIAEKQIKSNEKMKGDEIKSREKIAKEDRAQREAASKRQMFSGSITEGAKLAAKGLGAAAKHFLNDIRWYMNIPEIIKTIGNLPTFSPIGKLLGRSDTIDRVGFTNSLDPDISRPSVLTYYFVDTLGTSSSAGGDAINQALGRLQSGMRSQNSRPLSYDPADIGLLLFVETYVLCRLAQVKRVIEATQYYDANNIDIGKAVVTAWGFDFDNIKVNRGIVHSMWNALIERANKALFVPKGFNYFDRKLLMYTGLFCDENSKYSQMFVFRNLHSVTYDVVNSEVTFQQKATFKQLETLSSTGVGSLYHELDTLINEILIDGTLQDILADLQHAYANKVQIDPIEYPVKAIEPMYVDENLHQLMNATLPKHWVTAAIPSTTGPAANCAPKAYNSAYNRLGLSGTEDTVFMFSPLDESLTIYQDAATGKLVQGSRVMGIYNGTINFFGAMSDDGTQTGNAFVTVGSDTKLLNFYHDNPTDAEILEATRLTTRITAPNPYNLGSTNMVGVARVQSCMTEVLYAFGVTQFISYGPAKTSKLVFVGNGTVGFDYPLSISPADLQRLWLINQFNWMAPVNLGYPDDDDLEICSTRYNKQFVQAISMSHDQLDVMHSVCIQSLWFITEPIIKR